jgi:hypothetical protein
MQSATALNTAIVPTRRALNLLAAMRASTRVRPLSGQYPDHFEMGCFPRSQVWW